MPAVITNHGQAIVMTQSFRNILGTNL